MTSYERSLTWPCVQLMPFGEGLDPERAPLKHEADGSLLCFPSPGGYQRFAANKFCEHLGSPTLAGRSREVGLLAIRQ